MSTLRPHQGGRYQLRSRIATGGMGEVWRSEDTLLEREVAVKVLKHEYADDPVFRARFEAEARNAAALHHPNVASVFDVGELVEPDGSGTRRPFLVMELVPGQPLSALLRRGEPLAPERAAEVVAQAADAVAEAHGLGIVHRDVKPGNLLVTPDGAVKITDFGIARAGDGAAITQTGQIIGTPHYISPEQAEGKPATPASDIYALGVVLYECLAGRRPFARDTPIQVALAHVREEVPPLPETVPAQLRSTVEKALAKRPEDRFASASDLALALRGGRVPGFPTPTAAEAEQGDATRVLETSHASVARPENVGSRRRRLPAWWPWAVAAAAVLIVMLGTALLAGGEDGTPAAADDEATAGASTPTDDRVRVREAAYLGRDRSEVEDELEGLGLEVRAEEVGAVSSDQVQDTVAGVRPTGLVTTGTTVTLEVYAEFVEPPAEHGQHGEHEKDEKAEKDDGGKSDDKPDKGKGKGKKDD
jgi:tRNA A-37 threonylcarbamoyl transferase component Bud32